MKFIFRLFTLPFSLIYGLIISIRNVGFNSGIIKSTAFEQLTISIGNLKMGGTGKTPHIEYFVRLLSDHYRVATLSRGYGRKTKGFILANDTHSAEDIGDEPFQIKKKSDKITVAVCEKRVEGIEKLLAEKKDTEIILLDDAYQHRYVKPDLNVLLTEHDDLYIHDYTVPSGKLREPKRFANRADVIIVTKCPKNLTAIEMRSLAIDIKPKEYQKVFFSFLSYSKLKPLNSEAQQLDIKKKDLSKVNVILMTAIANPKKIIKYISKYNASAEVLTYPDHYYYREKDYKLIQSKFKNLTKTKVLIVTEKDATKLNMDQFFNIPVFSLPIEVKFHKNSDETFDDYILDYVRKY